MRLIKIFILIFLNSVFVLTVKSQLPGPLNDSINLNEIVVTGSKINVSRKLIPISVSQISSNEIESTGQMNVLPALNMFAPGVFVTERNILGFGVSTGGSGAISMRGISSSPNTNVLVLIDGHPQFQGIFGHPLADSYVSSDVQKVEIIRGPASLLYSSNAMAGVINIITKKQQEEGIKMNFGGSYGSFNTQKYFGNLGYKKNKFSIYTSLNRSSTDGIRSNTDFAITNGYTKASYRINDYLTTTIDANLTSYNGNDNGQIYDPKPFGIEIFRGKAAASIENNYKNWEGALKIYSNFGEHILSSGFTSTDQNSGLQFFQTLKLSSNNSFTFGTDIIQYGGMSNQGVNKDKQLKINEYAAYFHTQHKTFDKLNINAGVRLQYNTLFGTEFVPMAGLTYNPSSETTIKSSVSKGFRNPTIMEMYLFFPNPALQNPDLEPERMMNYEVSWLQSLFDNKIDFELTTYLVNSKNFIQVDGVYPNLQRQNTGKFSNYGIEFSTKYRITKGLHLHGNYCYLHLSKPMLAAPRQQLNFNVNYNRQKWNLNITAQYIEKLYTLISTKPNVDNVITPNYFLLHSRLSVKPIKSIEVFVAVNNMLNQKYQINYGYPMPGVNFLGGLNLHF